MCGWYLSPEERYAAGVTMPEPPGLGPWPALWRFSPRRVSILLAIPEAP